MADKILRPITDVEIVEQMTENDTVLIEQGGEIKRAKGVAGGSGGGSAGGPELAVQISMNPDRARTLVSDVPFEDVYNALAVAKTRVTIHLPASEGFAPQAVPVVRWERSAVGDQLTSIRLVGETPMGVEANGGNLGSTRCTWDKEVGAGETFTLDNCRIDLTAQTLRYETEMSMPINPTA